MPIGPSGATEVVVLSESVTLTNDEIKALPSTPITILAAEGAGKLVCPLMAILVLSNDAGAYTNVDPSSALYLVLDPAGDFDTGSVLSSSSFLSTGSTERLAQLLGGGLIFNSLLSRMEGITHNTISNTIVGIAADNGALGNFTGGHANNSLKVTVLYTVIDL